VGLEIVEPARADYTVRQQGAQTAVVPNIQGRRTKDGKVREADLLTMKERTETRASRHERRLTYNAKADNLLRVAAKCEADAEGTVVVKPQLWLAEGKADKRGVRQLKLPDPSLRLHDKDWVVIRIPNTNKFAIDVTVLYLDSDRQLEPLFPSRDKGESNRIRPGETAYISELGINANTVGPEQVVILAVRARSKDPVEFTDLARQPRDSATVKKLQSSPLGRVMTKAVFKLGETRGSTTEEAQEFGVKLIPYIAVAEKRAKEK
jgi:hypothetical protein